MTFLYQLTGTTDLNLLNHLGGQKYFLLKEVKRIASGLDLFDFFDIPFNLDLLLSVIHQKNDQEKHGYSCNTNENVFHHFLI